MHLRVIGCDMTANVTDPSSDNACKAAKQLQPRSCHSLVYTYTIGVHVIYECLEELHHKPECLMRLWVQRLGNFNVVSYLQPSCRAMRVFSRCCKQVRDAVVVASKASVFSVVMPDYVS